MKKEKRTKYRVLGLLTISLIIAAATYGFAGAHAVNSAAILGADFGVMSPYQVSKICYTLDESDPSYFTAVSFELGKSSAAVAAGVSATRGSQVTWAGDCQYNGVKWTCTFDDSISVLAADWLHVE
jgi:hypothetical protein